MIEYVAIASRLFGIVIGKYQINNQLLLLLRCLRVRSLITKYKTYAHAYALSLSLSRRSLRLLSLTLLYCVCVALPPAPTH